MSVLRGLLGGSALSLSLSLEAVGDGHAGRLDESVCKSSPDLQEIFPCVASINPHLLCHLSPHVSLVCVFHCGSLRLFALLFLPICAC